MNWIVLSAAEHVYNILYLPCGLNGLRNVFGIGIYNLQFSIQKVVCLAWFLFDVKSGTDFAGKNNNIIRSKKKLKKKVEYGQRCYVILFHDILYTPLTIIHMIVSELHRQPRQSC